MGDEQRPRARARHLDQRLVVERAARLGEHPFLHVRPEVRLPAFVRVVHQHVADASVGDLSSPPTHGGRDARDRAVLEQPQPNEHVQRADVGRRRQGDGVVESSMHRRERPFVAEGEPRMADAQQGPGMPEVLAGRRCHAALVARARPVVHEVPPAAVVSLHPQHELEQAAGPPFHFGVSGLRPDVAEHVEHARRVVDAGDALEPRLLGDDELAGGVGVHGERQRALPGGRQRSGEPGELSQHGSRWARMSDTEKSAAARFESAAP